MVREIAVERYAFRCRYCEKAWSSDYDVQYATDADGSLWAFYRHHGAPVENPLHDLILCPDCGRGAVSARLIARRDMPPATFDSDQPRHKVTSSAAQRRAAAPPMPSEVPTTNPRPRAWATEADVPAAGEGPVGDAAASTPPAGTPGS